jgi:DNA-binding response OmpR family regulator/anti-sigma regulatory factor (Ser/Thr protein kinase)
MIRADVNLYLRYIVEMFRSVAASGKITLNFTSAADKCVLDYDPGKLLQIISNLLSNALKFTPSGGSVEVSSAINDEDMLEIRVCDTGTGIPDVNLPHIFDRFYRADAENVDLIPGTGLGLALTKELVKLFDGNITVESIYGEGTEFVVTLPVIHSAPLHEGPGLHEMKERVSKHLLHLYGRESFKLDTLHHPNERPMLLVVEDNEDVVQYLMTILAEEYDVIVASNGDQGISKAIEYVPDIILSDVMMPVRDGISMLDNVKNDFRTSHIPVVLLTAKADISSRLEGLARGADAYIAKPFEREELEVQLRSLIIQRKKLQERYAGIEHPLLPEEKDFHFEDRFMMRVRGIMLANLGDESFDIHRFCSEMMMSRTQLYRKFRSLTNMTITEYLRSLRLHQARELLNEKGITVVEAAYKTGFKNLSHFSRVFKKEFGVNPSSIGR